MPHVVSLHSDKLHCVDVPPALNKPVAAPRVEPIAWREWRDFNRRLFVVLLAYWVLSHISSSIACLYNDIK